jgi:hypothetical protein
MVHLPDLVDLACFRLVELRVLLRFEFLADKELVDELRNSRSRSAVPLSTRVENSTVAEHDSLTQVDLVLILAQLGDDATDAALNDPRSSPRLNMKFESLSNISLYN